LSFSGLKLDDILDLLKAGKSDTEVLAWIREHSSRTEPEIMVWSQYELQRAPSDAEGREYY
jgi:fatty acid-binding protein DegV